jgi:hypothetical protein
MEMSGKLPRPCRVTVGSRVDLYAEEWREFFFLAFQPITHRHTDLTILTAVVGRSKQNVWWIWWCPLSEIRILR